jgi:D-alanine-D-alanine ligase
MGKLKVAVAMGGFSSECEISLKSGQVVCDFLDKGRYDIYPVLILNEGWFYRDPSGDKHTISKADFSFSVGDQRVKPDVIFNTIHGTPGEDGYMAAYWELLKIPQTSTGFYQAGLSFNKRDCLSVLKQFGINCAQAYYLNKGVRFDLSEIVRITGLPCFVKPNRAGSSFGVSKVYSMDELLPAIDKAFEQDSELIIETALVGTEVSVGAYRHKGEIIVLPPTEIVPEADFFDYAAKYLGKSQEITPARISEAEEEAVKTVTRHIYYLLDMKGVTRSDFILQDGVPYFIETNTTPGLSGQSIIPQQVRSSGMELAAFFDILIEEALEGSGKSNKQI